MSLAPAFAAREQASLAAHADTWAKNCSANRARVREQVDALWLAGNAKKGVLIAAGPSLRESLDELRALDRATHELVAVDMALEGLLAAGIVPDFVIAADANPVIGDLLEDASIERPELPLLLADVADPSVADRWKGPVFWYGLLNQHKDPKTGEFMEKVHERLSGVSARLAPGGNVSSLGLSFLVSVRACAKVLLYGHDFCWPADGPFYAPGAPDHLAQQRLAEERAAGTVYEHVASDGSKVLTNLSLLNFASWYHDVVHKAMPDLLEQRTPRTILSLEDN